ncbi:hypothetical protein F5B21DRAFT_375747 [Xylaria acuta]|nr:hypothetical protein F5B21DRAFT_375747 [Xylaria acuta]
MAGFTEVDWVSNDFSLDENHFTTLIVSSRTSTLDLTPETNLDQNKSVELVTDWNQTFQSNLCDLTSSQLRVLGADDLHITRFCELAAQDDSEDKIIVVAEDHENLSLEKMDAQQSDWLCHTLSRANVVMWLASPSPSTEVSCMTLANGLVRTFRQERVGLVFETVWFDASSELAALPPSLNRSLNHYLVTTKTGVYEQEMIQVGDGLLIPRVCERDFMNPQIFDLSSRSVERAIRFNERNIKIKMGQPGLRVSKGTGIHTSSLASYI